MECGFLAHTAHLCWLVCIKFGTATGIMTYLAGSRPRYIWLLAFALGMACDVGLITLTWVCGGKLEPIIEALRDEYVDGLPLSDLHAEIARQPFWTHGILRLLVAMGFFSEEAREIREHNLRVRPQLEALNSLVRCLRFRRLLQFSSFQETRSESDCTICFMPMPSRSWVLQLRRCGHMFHSKCIGQWYLINPTCPLCRS
eukprot:GGOE01014402.1.p1 GENE.GGOE01014402.1~~GGOE01014402.1.p1  ORF type:complete len:200 (-),score=31.59 GGOE01014402.1:184-783(-)